MVSPPRFQLDKTKLIQSEDFRQDRDSLAYVIHQPLNYMKNSLLEVTNADIMQSKTYITKCDDIREEEIKQGYHSNNNCDD